MGSASETLDKIRSGGQQAILLAIRRAEEAIEALKEGDFQGAYTRVAELQDRLQHLAHAEAHLGVFEDNWVVRAAEVTEGITLRGWGEVTDVKRVDLMGGNSVMIFTFSNGQQEQVNADTELAVVPESG